jgi:hypothetical protein
MESNFKGPSEFADKKSFLQMPTPHFLTRRRDGAEAQRVKAGIVLSWPAFFATLSLCVLAFMQTMKSGEQD